RKNSTQPINESAKIKFKKPGPKNDISPIAKIRKGKDNNKSAIRESTVSNHPLKYPAIKPKDVPTRTEIVVAIIPTAMETRVPSMIRENKSTPCSFVPSIWFHVPPSIQTGGKIRSARSPSIPL